MSFVLLVRLMPSAASVVLKCVNEGTACPHVEKNAAKLCRMRGIVDEEFFFLDIYHTRTMAVCLEYYYDVIIIHKPVYFVVYKDSTINILSDSVNVLWLNWKEISDPFVG